MELNFDVLKTAVQHSIKRLTKDGKNLYYTNTTKDELWDAYLASFPEGSNPKYKERTEHDCNCCRQFIKNIGNVVAINPDTLELESIWETNISGPYRVVADAMKELVTKAEIRDLFIFDMTAVGTDKSLQRLEDGSVLTWPHFHAHIPGSYVKSSAVIPTKQSNIRTTAQVFTRGLNELTLDSIDTVLDLIAQNSLYRGEEHKFALTEFRKVKAKYDKLDSEVLKNRFVWINTSLPESVTRFKNTVIGTLVSDLSEGYDLEDAVKSFEQKVAPTNYKRPTAVVSKKMIEQAKEKIIELGLTSSLERRYAKLEDISVQNILFANRDAKKRISGDVFDTMMDDASAKNNKNLSGIEEVTIDKFVSEILPTINSIELLLENRLTPNMVSLIAPVDPSAPTLFKWDNGFSWSYNGDVADSIKEKVKQAGGKVEGDLRCSLSWFNTDDLDLHMVEPSSEIYYVNKKSSITGGHLDVDMNVRSPVRNAVENIIYESKTKMKPGKYELVVHNFRRRETKDPGFEVEIEFDGNIHTFGYDKIVGKPVTVATISVSTDKKLTLNPVLPASTKSKLMWEKPTGSYHKVNVLMLSPNYWDNKTVGNKHYFFMLAGCENEGTARGFYNEFLKPELEPHRKVLEIVGSKMRTSETTDQLSGVGFSTTQRNHVILKVEGRFTRNLKVTF